MATLYAKTAGGNWSAAATWSNVNASGVDNSGPPTAADDTIFELLSGNVVIDAAAVCRSIDMTSGTGSYAGILNHDAAITLTIGDATAGAGNVALKFTGAGTYTIDNGTTSAIAFISTSATVQTINFNGFNTGNVTFNAASNGSWQLTGAWGTSSINSSETVTLTDGDLDTNGQAIYSGKFASSGTNAKTLTLGATTWSLSYPNGLTWSDATARHMTLNANTSTIIFTGAGVTIWSAKVYNIVQITGGGTFKDDGENTFATLIYTGTASKTDILQANNGFTVTGEFRVTGNSTINRVLVQSGALGTAPLRTLTLTGATVSNCTNVDFRDIAFTGAPDFSAITGGSGDCGGNTGATFTTADDWYFYDDGAGTFNFSDYTQWYTATAGGGFQMASTRCVLPQDNAYFDASSINGAVTVDQDMPRVCKTLDFTGVDAMNFHMNNVSQTIYGGLVFVDNVSPSTSSSQTLTFEGRSAFNFTPKASYSYNFSTTIQMIGGTLTLLANFTSVSGAVLTISNGTFDANDNNISYSMFDSSNSNARKILMGTGTWTVNRTTAVTLWNMATITNLDLTGGFAETSTIVFGANTANNQSFAGGGLTYNNLSITAGGAGVDTFSGSNTFNTFTINAPKTVKFTAATTTTVSSFVATGTAVNPITITSATAALHYLIDTSGTNTVSYCTIDYSEPRGSGEGGGALWDASDGTNVDGGHNTAYDSGTNEGWKFTSPTTTTTTTTSTTTTTTSTTTTTTTTSTTTTTTSTTTTTTTTSTTTTTTSTTTTTTTTSTTTTTTSTTTTTTSTTTTTTTTSTTTTTTSTTTTTTSTTTTTTTTSTTTTTTSTTTTTTTSSTTTTTTSTTTTSTTTTSATRSYFVFEDDVIKVVVKGVLVAKFKDDGDVDVNGVANDNAF